MTERPRGKYAPENTDDNGDYKVGKNRPPQNNRFEVGDGRPRGKRKKGTRNLATDLRAELDAKVTVTVGGKQTKVSRQRSIVMRMADNASRGQNPAIALTLDYQQRLVEPVLAREEQKKAETEVDFDRLSETELSVLVYLLDKDEGKNDQFERIVGVIPIYQDGHYVGDKNREAIGVGLGAYGIEVEEKWLNFPPRCGATTQRSSGPAEGSAP